MRSDIQVSLVVPCYNEVANLQKGVLDKIGNYVAKNKQFKEVIIVDDGSTDDSKEIIKKYVKTFPKFRMVENAHQGKAFAVITGFQKAEGNQVMFSDIDLATPIEEAEKLINEYKKGNDIVIGSRTSSRDGAPLTRKIMAFGLIMLRGIFLGLWGFKDTQCGFKLFDRKAALEIIAKQQVFKNGKTIKGSSVSAGFDLELLFLARKLGYSIKEVTVVWRHVETKNVNFIRDSIETLMDMMKIRMNHISGAYNFGSR